MVTALVLGGVFLLGMAVTAGYAARTLPAGARVPLNAGVPEHSVWLSKPAGLSAWLGVGVAAFAAFALLTVSSFGAGWSPSVRVVLLPCVMTVVLAAEAGAVIVARRCAADGPDSETLAEGEPLAEFHHDPGTPAEPAASLPAGPSDSDENGAPSAGDEDSGPSGEDDASLPADSQPGSAPAASA